VSYRTTARRINRNPLRLIVTWTYEDRYDRVLETLSCGHTQRARCDAYGMTAATRRRCRACGRAGKPAAGATPTQEGNDA
jgi:hypothetical protein